MEFSLKDKAITLFCENKEVIFQDNPAEVIRARESAFRKFKQLGFPTKKMEEWRNTNLSDILSRNHHFNFEAPKEDIDIEKIFQCEVPNFDTHIVSLYNGWYVSRDKPLETLPNGTIVGSFARALKEYPELVLKHYNKYCKNELNGLNALNTAFAQDGVFIYVPDNVGAYKPIQIVNILDKGNNLFVQNRNLIIVGKNSKLSFLHCDDSRNHEASFSNTVTEVFIDEGASVDHYKLQNLNDKTTLINSTFFQQEKDSQLSSFAITLNGGIVRNDSHVLLNNKGIDSNIYGLYLVDKEQHVDNRVFVDHASPNCTSNELFKGILDDQGSAAFNGHVLVRRDAQQTNACQTNRNILLTDKAKAHAKPFLEIYADDVKCSHGATVGQLDDEALFYIKSRGISEYNAKLLLMYAFAAEVVNKISLPALKSRIDDLVKKRLRGELAVCSQCVLHCQSQEQVYDFKIDMSKL
ncbi:MAG: Fe-S cluster assembly protein SufD [Chlorobi bacterium]|nr:Fe-S cluster assembly protein SufD [Chlorobiota bacterium]